MIEDLKHLKDVLNRYIAKYERQQVFGQNTEEMDLRELGNIIHRFIDKYEEYEKNKLEDWTKGNDYY